MKACIFDLDGTLVDSEMLYVEALRKVLDAAGTPMIEERALEVVYGRSRSDVFNDVNAHAPNTFKDPFAMDDILRTHIRSFEEITDIRIHSSVSVLRKIGERIPVAIISGSARVDIQTAIELLEIEASVSFFIGAEDYAPGKPDPTCFLMGAEKFGVKPSECVVFEDSTAGVAAAKAAGMTCIALARPEAPAQNTQAADQVVGDLGEVDLEALLAN